MNDELKTVFVAIIGSPNAGKSSLLNRLLGEKIAIVSPKPQTTRTRIMGVRTERALQLVLTDTPGLQRPKTKLGEHMAKAVRESLNGVDLCFLVTDGTKKISTQEEELLQTLSPHQPTFLILNKIDLARRDELMEKTQAMSAVRDYAAVIPISAKTGAGISELELELQVFCQKNKISEGFFFPEDTLTDQPERVVAAELLREQILKQMDQEIPHGVAVVVEKMRERPAKTPESKGLLDIDAVIFCERETHKGMLIGKQGQKLKALSSAARRSMEGFFGCQVNLQCWVKVKENWRNRDALIQSFSLD